MFHWLGEAATKIGLTIPDPTKDSDRCKKAIPDYAVFEDQFDESCSHRNMKYKQSIQKLYFVQDR